MNASPVSDGSVKKNALSPNREPPRITLVTEAFNLAEGQSEASFHRALDAVAAIFAGRSDVEVIVLDPSEKGLASPILASRYPHFTAITVPGLSYDGQKNLAAQVGRGEYLVFLDGDCAPVRQDWLDQITGPLKNDHVHAVGGLTLYDDFSPTGKAMSILDFGFLFEAHQGAPLGCYASNNVAFRRETYLRYPAPDEGVLRSYCYKHAQLMLRAGVPVISNPQAFVLHELPDVQKERFRRGYDHIAALWCDPELPLARVLENTPRFAQKILSENLALALARMSIAPRELDVRREDHFSLAMEFQRLMGIDALGVAEAMASGTPSRLQGRVTQIVGD